MSERRYLERGAVHTASASLDSKVVPRREDDDTLYGSSGRIHRPSSKYIPGSKSWFAGYNVQGQDDPLVETYPVGLRRRRLWCIVGLVVLCAILSSTAFIGALWILHQLNVDSRGMHAMVIEGNEVGFLHEFGADEVFVHGGAQVFVVQSTHDEPTIFAAEEVELHAISQLRSLESTLNIGGPEATLHSTRLAVSSDDSTLPHFTAEVEQSRIASETFVVDQNLTVGPQLEVREIGPTIGDPLVVDARGNLRAQAFRECTLSSSSGHVRVAARGAGSNLSFLNTNNIITALPFIESTVQAQNGSMYFDLSGLRRPDAVSNANQTSFTVCTCGNDDRLYLVQGNTTCASTPAQYLSSPCA